MINTNNFLFLKHLFIILFFVLLITLSNIVVKKEIIVKSENIYLDPIETAFIVESIVKYTPNINENLIALEENLFFAQIDEMQYINKKNIKNNYFVTEKTQLEREYVIQNGDTITGIANRFDMHVATIYERNELNADNIESLKPGDKLIIPAYDQSNSKEWLVQLNDKKEQERQRLLALQREEAQRQSQLAYNSRNTYTRSSSTSGRSIEDNYSGYNGYPYGWCTYYVASRKNIPSNWGNAGDWLYSAQRSGYSTGGSPAVGAVIVTGESWWGHVGIIESVNDNLITISEMNYNGWGVTSSRTISAYNPVIKGYIY